MSLTRARKHAIAKSRKQQANSKNKPSKWTTKTTTPVRTTRAMKTNGPKIATFETAEILEQILLHLPLKSLWACQRVCRQFQAMTKTSPVLQEEMMMRRGKRERESWRLEAPIPRWTVPSTRDNTRFVADVEGTWTPARLCPLLNVYKSEIAPAIRCRGNWYGESVIFTCLADIVSNPGSWRDVLVTDPPTFEARVYLTFIVGHYGIPDGVVRIHRNVSNPSGLRMGDLIEGALQMEGHVNWEVNGRKYYREKQKPGTVLRRLEEKMGVKGVLDLDEHGLWCSVKLKGRVIPSAEEWEEVEQ